MDGSRLHGDGLYIDMFQSRADLGREICVRRGDILYNPVTYILILFPRDIFSAPDIRPFYLSIEPDRVICTFDDDERFDLDSISPVGILIQLPEGGSWSVVGIIRLRVQQEMLQSRTRP